MKPTQTTDTSVTFTRFKYFHLIKDVTTETKIKKIRQHDVLFDITTVTRRYLFGKISWILSIHHWDYTEPKGKNKTN